MTTVHAKHVSMCSELEKNIQRLEKIVCYYQIRRFAVILTPEEEKLQADAERELKIEDDKLYNLIYKK